MKAVTRSRETTVACIALVRADLNPDLSTVVLPVVRPSISAGSDHSEDVLVARTEDFEAVGRGASPACALSTCSWR